MSKEWHDTNWHDCGTWADSFTACDSLIMFIWCCAQWFQLYDSHVDCLAVWHFSIIKSAKACTLALRWNGRPYTRGKHFDFPKNNVPFPTNYRRLCVHTTRKVKIPVSDSNCSCITTIQLVSYCWAVWNVGYAHPGSFVATFHSKKFQN